LYKIKFYFEYIKTFSWLLVIFFYVEQWTVYFTLLAPMDSREQKCGRNLNLSLALSTFFMMPLLKHMHYFTMKNFFLNGNPKWKHRKEGESKVNNKIQINKKKKTIPKWNSTYDELQSRMIMELLQWWSPKYPSYINQFWWNIIIRIF
jgi:hypothetical protein